MHTRKHTTSRCPRTLPSVPNAGSSARTLQQQQPSSTNNDDGLVVADDSSSPSTATTIPNNNTNASTPNVLSRLGSALLPKSIKSQLQLLRSSMAQAVQDHSSGRRARAAAALHPRMRPLHHHRVVRHNTTHTWVHSPLLDLELPQPWDALNLTTIVRCVLCCCKTCAGCAQCGFH